MGVEVDGLVGLDSERCAQVGDEGDVKCRSPLLFEHEQVGDERVDDVAVVVFEGDDYGKSALVDAQDLADFFVWDLDREDFFSAVELAVGLVVGFVDVADEVAEGSLFAEAGVAGADVFTGCAGLEDLYADCRIGWGDDSEVDGCGVVADEGGLGDEVYAPVVLSGRTGEVRDGREWHQDQSR